MKKPCDGCSAMTPLLLFLGVSLWLAGITTAAKRESIVAPLERYDFRTCYNATSSSSASSSSSSIWVPSLMGNRSLLGALHRTAPEDFICDLTEQRRGTHALSSIPTHKYMMESNSTLESFQKHFTGPGRLTVGLWMTPGYDFYSGIRPILTFGDTNFHPHQMEECRGHDLRILQIEETLVISFTDREAYCQTLRVRPVLLTRTLTHVAVSFGETHFQLYMNGLAVYPTGWLDKTVDVRNWFHIATSTLQLFANYQDAATFQGSLLQVDLYDQTLTDSNVAAIFANGMVRQEDVSIVDDDDDNGLDGNATGIEGGNSTDDNGTDSGSNSNENDEEDEEYIVRIVAKNAEPVVISQGMMDPIQIALQGLNKTISTIFLLAIQVTSLPNHGTLFTSIGKISVDDIFPYLANETGITVFYAQSSHSYFNAPTTNAYGMDLRVAPESFGFRIVSFQPMSTIVNLVSETIAVPIYVVHVNHGAPMLQAPDEATLDPIDPTKATVHGIQVMDNDLDLNMDHVRVDVLTKDGTVTLNSLYWVLADSESCAQRSYSWQCIGSGPAANRRLTFVAIPGDISLILQNIMYKSFGTSGSPGEIVVRIYDGVGGSCLDESEHRAFNQVKITAKLESFEPQIAATDHNKTCHVVEKTILVPGFDPTVDGPDREGGGGLSILGFEWKEFIFGATGIVLTLFCVCGWWRCCCKWPRCLVRRSQTVEPDVTDEGTIKSISDDTP